MAKFARATDQHLAQSPRPVERVLVDGGARVKAGDVLVQLDQDAARVQLQQARAAQPATQAKLGQLENGARVEDVAAAQAALNVQQIKLQNMRRADAPKTLPPRKPASMPNKPDWTCWYAAAGPR